MQAQMAQATWVGMHADHSELSRFVDDVTGTRKVLPPEALPGMIRSASAGLPRISRAEFEQNRR